MSKGLGIYSGTEQVSSGIELPVTREWNEFILRNHYPELNTVSGAEPIPEVEMPAIVTGRYSNLEHAA